VIKQIGELVGTQKRNKRGKKKAKESHSGGKFLKQDENRMWDEK